MHMDSPKPSCGPQALRLAALQGFFDPFLLMSLCRSYRDDEDVASAQRQYESASRLAGRCLKLAVRRGDEHRLRALLAIYKPTDDANWYLALSRALLTAVHYGNPAAASLLICAGAPLSALLGAFSVVDWPKKKNVLNSQAVVSCVRALIQLDAVKAQPGIMFDLAMYILDSASVAEALAAYQAAEIPVPQPDITLQYYPVWSRLYDQSEAGAAAALTAAFEQLVSLMESRGWIKVAADLVDAYKIFRDASFPNDLVDRLIQEASTDFVGDSMCLAALTGRKDIVDQLMGGDEPYRQVEALEDALAVAAHKGDKDMFLHLLHHPSNVFYDDPKLQAFRSAQAALKHCLKLQLWGEAESMLERLSPKWQRDVVEQLLNRDPGSDMQAGSESADLVIGIGVDGIKLLLKRAVTCTTLNVLLVRLSPYYYLYYYYIYYYHCGFTYTAELDTAPQVMFHRPDQPLEAVQLLIDAGADPMHVPPKPFSDVCFRCEGFPPALWYAVRSLWTGAVKLYVSGSAARASVALRCLSQPKGLEAWWAGWDEQRERAAAMMHSLLDAGADASACSSVLPVAIKLCSPSVVQRQLSSGASFSSSGISQLCYDDLYSYVLQRCWWGVEGANETLALLRAIRPR